MVASARWHEDQIYSVTLGNSHVPQSYFTGQHMLTATSSYNGTGQMSE